MILTYKLSKGNNFLFVDTGLELLSIFINLAFWKDGTHDRHGIKISRDNLTFRSVTGLT